MDCTRRITETLVEEATADGTFLSFSDFKNTEYCIGYKGVEDDTSDNTVDDR
jgi:hypothetical protein